MVFNFARPLTREDSETGTPRMQILFRKKMVFRIAICHRKNREKELDLIYP